MRAFFLPMSCIPTLEPTLPAIQASLQAVCSLQIQPFPVGLLRFQTLGALKSQPPDGTDGCIRRQSSLESGLQIQTWHFTVKTAMDSAPDYWFRRHAGPSGRFCGFVRDALSRSGIFCIKGLQPRQRRTSCRLFRSGDLHSTTPQQNSTFRVMSQNSCRDLSQWALDN